MKRTRIFFITLLLTALLTGCAFVVSKHPVGLENYFLEPEEWNGTWMNGDGVVTIKVIDESKGILQLAWIETSGEELAFESMKCRVMKGGNWLYVNVLEMPEDNVQGYFLWAKLAKESRRIMFWRPSVEAFQEAAEAKKIEAIVNEVPTVVGERQRTEDVRLLDTPEKIIDLIEHDGSKYFEWEEPAVLIRLRK